MKYYYRTYGLDIESDIEIDEFIKIDKKELLQNKVTIKYGDIPEKYILKKEEGSNIGFDNEEVWFHIKNIASYLICYGNTIIVQPYEDADKQLIKLYLMCSCLGFIMLQRGKVAIHGGVINIEGKTIILTGDRGAGKSTLTTALRQRGHKLISDDVAAINIDNEICVMPGFPHQKLCEDTMDKLGYNKALYSSFAVDGRVKYIVPAKEAFIDEDTELFSICEIIAEEDIDEVKIEEISGREKLSKVIHNIYRAEFIASMGGVKPNYFKGCLNIAKNIKYYKVMRPKNGFTISEQIKKIEEICKMNN